MNAIITLREYLKKNKCFVIPNYQRGYVWGKNKAGGGRNSVEYMLDSLKNGYKTKTEVFIQGVTVSELPEDKEIILIDGQQRTTFFYLLLKWLGYNTEPFKIEYMIRTISKKFLENLKKDNIENIIKETKDEYEKEEFQDIYFFKKTLRIISEHLKFEEIEKEEETEKKLFCEYVLDNVKFLYINIPINRATKVFTMMNGNKAEMKDEELIKAELLRLASLNGKEKLDGEEKEKYAREWDNNMLRSRYAREWDKWLQWWNRDDVKRLYKLEADCVMGLLVSTYQKLAESEELSFERFKNNFLKNQKPIEAKQAFDGLRRLQKRFEDAFNNPITYNKIGAIIRISNDKDAFIKWYFLGEKPSKGKSTRKDKYSLGKTPKEKLEEYYKLAFLELTHNEITDPNELHKVFKDKYGKLFGMLKENILYDKSDDNKMEAAFRLLLRLNIDEDNLQENQKGRKFDFSIWDRSDSRGRSLEHIYPKSKVYHMDKDGEIKDGNNEVISEDKKEDGSYICRETCSREIEVKKDVYEKVVASEHSIGNLVLLYKDDNSTFNNSSFEEKKRLFFKNDKENKEAKAFFKSRHLLHTIYKFANSKWDGEEIAKNQHKTLNDFKKYYEELNKQHGTE